MSMHDDDFVERLADMDEALAAGQTPRMEKVGADPIDTRLQKGMAALQALRKIKSQPQAHQTTPANRLGDTPSNLPPGPTPRQLGRFQVIRELGRGGFGVVFLAHDPRLQRDVALKVPHISGLFDDSLRDRFRREATTAASLKHANIVSVFEADDFGPVCWIAYEYCPGKTLSEWMADQRAIVPAHEAAELLATLADAVQHAHDQGIVHRDLKPANILVENETNDSSDHGIHLKLASRAKITDFGLAKLIDQAGTMTRTGAILGTPAYMAPEQARGKFGGADERADIYALGAILYELLVGRPPFQGETDVETLQLVHSTDAVRPSQLRPKLPRDLETICLKCLEKDPIQRYARAADLRDDLRRFMAGEPVVARPVGRTTRVIRWCRRKPAIAALSCALVVATTLGVVGMTSEYRRANHERDSAVAANEKNKLLVQSLADENARANRERDTAVAASNRNQRLLTTSNFALQEMIDLGLNLTHTPQTVDHGTAMLRTAHQYYGKLIAEDPNNEDLNEKAAIICRRLALIYKEKQKFSDCELMWAATLEHCQRRLTAAPNDPKRRYDLYFATSGLAYAKEMLGKIAESTSLRGESEEMIEALLAQFPEQPAYQDAVSRACFNRGELARQRRQFHESEPEFVRCADLDRKIAKQLPEYDRCLRLIASLNRLADSRNQLKRYDEAESNAKESLERCQELAARFPDRPPESQRGMAWFVLRQVYGARENWADALNANRETLAIVAKLKDRPSPDGDFYHQFLRQTIRIMECFDKLGRAAEAIPFLQAAVSAEVPDFRPKDSPPEILTCVSLLLQLQHPRNPTLVTRANELLSATAEDPKCANARAKLAKALAEPPRTSVQP